MNFHNYLFENLFSEQHVNSFMTTKQTAFKSLISTISKTHFLVRCKQTHSNHVAVIDHISQKKTVVIPDTDALITNQKNTFLSIKAADCMPILVHHERGWIAAIHAGRDGTKKKILEKTLNTLCQLVQDNSGFSVWFGPCLCKQCHEIDSIHHIHFDLIEENKRQLDSVLSDQRNRLSIENMCTACNSNYHFHSYRGDNFTKKRNYIFISLK